MRFGVCGLGRMGASLALQAIEKGHEVVGFDAKGSDELEAAGVTVVSSIGALAQELPPPRVALSYVPHGEPTEEVISDLAEAFDEGDIVVDGGNTHWNESSAGMACWRSEASASWTPGPAEASPAPATVPASWWGATATPTRS